jgi:predicted permease
VAVAPVATASFVKFSEGRKMEKMIYNVALLFLMMVPGIILKKCKLSTDGLGKGISNLVLYVAQPSLIFLAYVRPYSKEILINSLWVLLFSVITHIVFSVITLNLFNKAPDRAKRMLRMATIFSNAAFMGIPLIEVVISSTATLYASVYNITFNLFLWSLGVKICTDGKDIDGDGKCDGELLRKRSGASMIKAILHPVTLAALAGLVCFFSPLDQFLTGSSVIAPVKLIMEGLTMMKSLVAPLSMVVLGMRIADIDFKGFFKDKYLYLFLAMRHFVLPLIIGGIMKLVILVGVPLANDIFAVVMILAAAPSASSATMFAEMYDGDAPYVSKLVAVSTILSIVSMPLVLLPFNISL